jgi:leucyl-tRNA synthetase
MTKALRDLGYVKFDEPFLRLFNHGMVNDELGRKQSKSLGNVTEPMEVIRQFGADALRIYLLFKTSYNSPINWENSGPRSARQYLERVMRLVTNKRELLRTRVEPRIQTVDQATNDADRTLILSVHATVEKVTRDVEKLSFNTAIAAVMSLTNAIYLHEETANDAVVSTSIRNLIRLLGIFAPHIAEEMWMIAGHNTLLALEPWPNIGSAAAQMQTIVMPVQMNGRLVTTLNVSPDIDEHDLLNIAMGEDDVIRRLGSRAVRAHRYVKGRVINLVVD